MSSVLHEKSHDKGLFADKTAFVAGASESSISKLKKILLKKGFVPIIGTNSECISRLPDDGFPLLHILDITENTFPLHELLDKTKKQNACTCIIAFDDHSYSKAVELLSKGAYALIRTPINPQEIECLIDRHTERLSLYKENEKTKSYLTSLEEAVTVLLLSPKRLAKSMYLSDFGQAIMTEFQNTLNASGGSFFVLEDNKLLRVFSLDPGHVPEEIELPLSKKSLLGQAHELLKPILVKDLRLEKTGAPSGWEGYTDNSTLILPLIHNHNHVLGFISLHNKKKSSFSEHDAAIGSALASVGSGILTTLKELFASQKRENQFRRFFLEAHAANAVIAPDSTILLMNQSFELMLGITLKEKQILFSDLLDSTDSWEKMIMKLKKQQHLYQHEFRIHTRKNSTICVTGNITGRYDKDSSLIDIYFSLADITEKRTLEHELSHSLKMEAVGRLAGGVAHDFNNLIAVILGYSEILIESLKDTTYKNDIQEIKQAGEKAAELAKQLCYFSRKQVERQSVINLNDSVTEMERMLRRLLGENIILYNDFNTKQAFITVDKGQIEQVIMNLVINARDAMPDGGTITIATQEIQNKTAENNIISEVSLTISDTGFGIPEEVKTHIFDPFFSTKEHGKGTGLGLATVHAIVQTAGGRIKVDSIPGRGTSFTLFFPKAVDEPVSGLSPAETHQPLAGTEHILLLEDDENVRNLLIKLLSYQGYTVTAAETSAEALRLFDQIENKDPIDLLITDMLVPGITGKEVADLLRKKRPLLPVLFISGYGDETLIKNGCTHDRTTNFITKPFDNETLQRKVREILDNTKEINSDTK